MTATTIIAIAANFTMIPVITIIPIITIDSIPTTLPNLLLLQLLLPCLSLAAWYPERSNGGIGEISQQVFESRAGLVTAANHLSPHATYAITRAQAKSVHTIEENAFKPPHSV